MAAPPGPGSNDNNKSGKTITNTTTQKKRSQGAQQDQRTNSYYHRETFSSNSSNASSSRTASPTLLNHDDPIPEFDQTFVNEEHMEAFRRALDDSLHSESSAELISAVTDFIPVQQTPTKRTRKTQRRRYNGYSYTLLRVPLMVWLFPLYLTVICPHLFDIEPSF